MDDQAAIRKLRARIGGLTVASQRNPLEYTALARAAAWRMFVDMVDPHRVLSQAERLRRAEAARRLYLTRLALASVKSRSKKPEGPAA